MSTQFFLNVLQDAALLLIIASSFAPIYYITKFINISHAVTIALGSYCALLFTRTLHFPLLLALPVAVLMATLFGVASEIFVYKRLRKLDVSPSSQLIASIGLYVVCQNCISLVFGDQSQRLNQGDIQLGYLFFGGYISPIAIVTVIASGLIFLVLLFFTSRTRLGLVIRAVSDNKELSGIYGVDPDNAILVAYLVGSAVGAIAGILFAIDTSLYPTMGFNLLLFGLSAMIIGGVGSYRGLIGGTLVIVLMRHLSGYYLDAKWMDAVAYSILLLFLIWKPYGFSGNRLRKIEV